MEFRSIRVAVTLVVLLAIVMVLFSCNRSPEVAKIAADAEAETSKPLDDPCLNTLESNRVSEIQRYLNARSMRDEELNDQRYDNRFRFHAEPYNGTNANLRVLVRVYGRVIGQDDDNNDKPPKMVNFLRFLQKGMRKGCIDRVSFEPMPSSVASPSPGTSPTPGDAQAAVISEPGFEWQTCAHPEFPCDTGRCSQGQMCKKDDKPESTPTPSPSPTQTP